MAKNTFNAVVGEIESRQKQNKTEEIYALVKLGISEIFFSRLHLLKNPSVDKGEEDKYTCVLALEEADRELLLSKLIPVAEEIAKRQGFAPKAGEVEKSLKKRIHEMEDVPGKFRLGADQRMAFANPEFHTVDLPVVVDDKDNSLFPDVESEKDAAGNPTGIKPLAKRFLGNGSEGFIQFEISSFRDLTKVLKFSFRLKSVRVTKYVPYEFEEKDNKPSTNFSDVVPGY